MPAPSEVAEAQKTRRSLRVHTRDGEVLVCRVLAFDDSELTYAVETSSRPERYAVCDSTGFTLAWEEIERIALTPDRPGRRAPRGAGGRSS
jgi:hypothetical protein